MTTGFDIIGSNKALQDHWLRRLIAIIIDGIIIAVIGTVIGLFLVFNPIWAMLWWLFWCLFLFLYFIVFEVAMRGTPGKKLMSLEVVGTDKELDFVASLIRNVSKIVPFAIIIDWLVGMFTDGDPRQKFTDRFANTTVQRTDEKAYLEQQFKQMAYVPPHPTYQPPPAQPYQQQAQPPPQQPAQAPATAWPHQEQTQPKSDWPQHDPGQPPAQQQPPQQQYQPQPQPQYQPQPQPQYQPQPQPQYQPPQEGAPRFCQNCGSTLSPGADGRPTCAKCGRVY